MHVCRPLTYMSINHAVAWPYLCLPSRNNLARKGPFLLHLAGSCKNPEESCRNMHVRLLQDPATCKREGPFLARWFLLGVMLLQKGLSMEQPRYSTLKGKCDKLHAAINNEQKKRQSLEWRCQLLETRCKSLHL